MNDDGFMYYNKFNKIHALLKKYFCKPTFDFIPEYVEDSETDIFFYKPFKVMINNDEFNDNWHEKIVATLDVEIKAKVRRGKNAIRFNIKYSSKVNKYDMNITCPASYGRDVVLNKNNYKDQDEVIKEINKWLDVKSDNQVERSSKFEIIKGTSPIKFGEQISMF